MSGKSAIDQLLAAIGKDLNTNTDQENTDMTNTNILSRNDARSEALKQLAVLGGRIDQESDIVFEGMKFVLPERFKDRPRKAVEFLNDWCDGQEETINVSRTFKFRPWDGANATYHCLRTYFGYAQSVPIPGFFGDRPPEEITIDVGYVGSQLQTVTVPWGKLILPGLTNAFLYTGSDVDREAGPVFTLTASCLRVEKRYVDGFFDAVQAHLETKSIYRGHAINGGLTFIDTDVIDPSQFVYTEEVWAQIQTHILSPMRDAKILQERGFAQKRVVLLEGPYGTGKSGLGRAAAKVAHKHGWTAIIARPGVDDAKDVLRTARMYQPSLVFIEDVDTIANNMDPDYVTGLLDMFDGFGTKDLQMLLVLTTNHADKIHKGMLRPGRLDSVIHIGNMDRPGVEKLAGIVVGDALASTVDFDAVYASTDGFTPSYVKEGLERAVRYTIARTGEVSGIDTVDLVNAMASLRAQYDLQGEAKDQHAELPTLDAVFRDMVGKGLGDGVGNELRGEVDNVVENRLDGAVIRKPNGDAIGTINTN